MIATTATQLYYEFKQKLMDKVGRLPNGMPLCASVNFWTTKDQAQSYFSIFLQWIDPMSYVFCKTLVAFESMSGSHSGVSLAWMLWEALSEQGMIKGLYRITGNNAANNISMTMVLQHKFGGIGIAWPKSNRFHQCACHVINLVTKEILAYMGDLTDEDYNFFENYLGSKQALIEDSDDDHNGPLGEIQQAIKRINQAPGKLNKILCNQPLNHANLEAQDKLGDLALIEDQYFIPSDPDVEPQSQSDICAPSKQQDIFIKFCDKTCNPKVLPNTIPMTHWNFFLQQIKQAHQLKLSLQLYTNTQENLKYQLTEEQGSVMEFMEPILQMFEQLCNLFQSKGPTKHLLFPYYQVLLNWLSHYASVAPNSWRRACDTAWQKLSKYYKLEIANDDSLIACLFNPKYHEGIFNQLGVPIHHFKEIIKVLNIELASMITKQKLADQAQLELQCGSPQELSETENTDLLRHLKHPPIEASDELLRSEGDNLLCYLQNLHPMTKGEPTINYWKCQIITGNFPTLGKISLRYLSIAAGSACVQRVFSHSGRLKTPTRAALGSRTIAHLTCLKEWLNEEAPPF
ncbi:hypothetical protein O181_107752 [Austropuccinia psidii MF-1]|uniref:HAT C-terminal dimerisation domain-containing protein n=1 Tax=Austropuccinia psidii MF-1 TaxID=1389203 RepID=A0A9Q3JUL1_9BASI|nr:hypothetical protein [Austropuccinia psidii MF-1]